jgi:hypothetical protein
MSFTVSNACTTMQMSIGTKCWVRVPGTMGPGLKGQV